MNAISNLARQAGYQTVLGDSSVVKLAADTGVPVTVLQGMAMMSGLDYPTLLKAAYDHPAEFFEAALGVEKQAGNGQFNQALTRGVQTQDPAAMRAIADLPNKEPMTGRLKEQTLSPGKMGVAKHTETNPTKQLDQAVAEARPAPGSKQAPSAMPHGDASPRYRLMGGRKVGDWAETGMKTEGNPMLKLLRLVKQKFTQGTAGMPGIGKMPAASRLRLAGGAAGAGAAAAGIGGLAAMMGGRGGGGAGAPPATATAATPPAAPEPQAAGIGGGLASAGGGILDWVKANPGKAGLLGLGAGGAAYGLSKLVGGSKKEKAAGDYFGDLPRNRQELEKRAAEVIRHNSTVILNRHLDKLAADANPEARRALRTIQTSVLGGSSLHTGIRRAFPKMAAERRYHLARKLTKGAWDEFQKVACSAGCKSKTASRKEFHGKPEQASGWLRENA